MPENAIPERCPTCGAELSSAAGGLCPKCLMKTAMDTEAPTDGPDVTSPETLTRFFPEYELYELLGRGGMGAVYRARHRKLARQVALKILLPNLSNDPEFAARFTREAQAMARLDHPNVVGVHDFGEREGVFYLVMEFVDGSNLRELIDSGSLTARDALKIVPQICDALQFAHDRRVVHRDVKPENILLDEDLRVRIADFGLAKLMGEGGDRVALTRTEQVFGTPQYMAPEQMKMTAEVDHRADIYSLGVVLYEMLTGDLPMGRFAAPSEKGDVDPAMDDVVLKSLESEPDKRYQSADEVKAGVEGVGKTAAKPVTPDRSMRSEPEGRVVSQTGTGVGVVLGLVAIMISSFMPWGSTYGAGLQRGAFGDMPLPGGGSISCTAWNSNFFGIPNWIPVIFGVLFTSLRIARARMVEVPNSVLVALAVYGLSHSVVWLLVTIGYENMSPGTGTFFSAVAFGYLLYVTPRASVVRNRSNDPKKQHLSANERAEQLSRSRSLWIACFCAAVIMPATFLPWDSWNGRNAFDFDLHGLVLIYALFYLGETCYSVLSVGKNPSYTASMTMVILGFTHSILAIVSIGAHVGPGPVVAAFTYGLTFILLFGRRDRRKIRRRRSAKVESQS